MINKIHNENCLETMKRMEDNFIDLTVTSPPYDNLRDYNGYLFDFESIANELFRVTKEGGVVVWVVGDATINGSETGTSFKQALYFKEIGFNLHDTMIYQRFSQFPPSKRYMQNFEYMFVLSKDTPTTFNAITKLTSRYKGNRMGNETTCARDKNGILNKKSITTNKETPISNIWNFNQAINHTEDKQSGHPAIFPENLAKDNIHTWSNEGDLIYDPFMGSGTTAKMAHLQKRNWIGSEMSTEYVELANKRIKPYLDQLTIF